MTTTRTAKPSAKFTATVDIIFALVREWQARRITTALRNERASEYLTRNGMSIMDTCYRGQPEQETRQTVTAAVSAGN